LPLQFDEGTTRLTLSLDGTETYDVSGDISPGGTMILVVNRNNGETLKVSMTCRLDTADEVRVYQAGGVLQRFAQDFLESSAA
jgi:aconitase A